MKKYLFVINNLKANGAERVMSLIVNKVCRGGGDVTLLFLKEKLIEYPIDERVKVVTIGDYENGKTGSPLRSLVTLRKILKKINPDIVLSFLTTCNIYACLSAFGLGIPVIVSERNTPNLDCTSRKRRKIRDFAYKLAKGFIFQTEEAKKVFSEKIQKRSIVIPNPVKDELPLSDMKFDSRKIVAAGRLVKQKNYRMMLDAFALFLSSHEGYSLHIFGDGEEKEELISYTKTLNISKEVIFHGAVKNVHDQIKDASMFLLSSDFEGISNSLLEALAMGLPVVSTDCPCGGSKMLIGDNERGLLSPVGNAEAFAENMKLLAESRELQNRVSKAAVTVRTIFSEKEIISKYVEYMDKVSRS